MTSSSSVRHRLGRATAVSARGHRRGEDAPRAAWPAGCGRASLSGWPFSDSACAGSSWPKNALLRRLGPADQRPCLRSGPSSAAAAASGTSCAAPASPWAARSSPGRARRGASAARDRAVGAIAARREHQRLAPDLRQEVAQVGRQRQRLQRRAAAAACSAAARAARSPCSSSSARRRRAAAPRACVCSAMKRLERGQLVRRRARSGRSRPRRSPAPARARGRRNCVPGPSSKSSKAQASEAMRLTKRRTGWRARREEASGRSSATRSTGNCSRAIWRAICGGTSGSDRIWSNRLPTTSITMWSSVPVEAWRSSSRWARIRFDRHQAGQRRLRWIAAAPPSAPSRRRRSAAALGRAAAAGARRAGAR